MEGWRVGAYGWESRAILTRHAFLVGWIVAVVIVVAVHVVVARATNRSNNNNSRNNLNAK